MVNLCPFRQNIRLRDELIVLNMCICSYACSCLFSSQNIDCCYINASITNVANSRNDSLTEFNIVRKNKSRKCLPIISFDYNSYYLETDACSNLSPFQTRQITSWASQTQAYSYNKMIADIRYFYYSEADIVIKVK